MSQVHTQQMGRLTAAGNKNRIDEMIDCLANLNALHFIEYDGLEEGFNLGTPKDDAEITGRRLNKLRSAASIIEGKSPKKPVPAQQVRSDLDSSLPDAVDLLLEKRARLDSIEDEISNLKEEEKVLELIASLDLDADLLSGYENVSSFVGTINDIDSVKKMDYHNLLFVGKSKKVNVIALFVKTEYSVKTQSLLNSCGFEMIGIKENLHGKTTDLLSEVVDKLNFLKSEKSLIENDLETWNNDFGESLTCGLELLEREHDIMTAPVKIAVSNHAFFIDGWVEMTRSEEIKLALEGCCIFIDISPFKIKAGDGGHGHSDHSHNQEMPPIAYQNRNLSRPMELLTDAVGRPAYGRIDPTLFMFVTYPIFFGMMLGDMAYGLITISLGMFIMGQAGTNNLMSLGGKFLIYIGLGTFVFGYLYAEFAGWEIFPHGHSNPAEALSVFYPPVDSHGSVWHESYPFGIELAYPFHRVVLVEDYGNLEHLVVLTIYMGLIHIIFGRLIGFRDVMFYGTDHGHIGIVAAFFEHGVWIVLLIGGFFFSYGFLGPSEAEYMMMPGMFIAISAVIMLIWTLFYYHGIPLAISLILAPIEAIGMMPSVISYVRLFAVGVVGVKIAETGNLKLFEPMVHAIENNEFIIVPFLLVGWLSVQFFAWGLGVFSPNIHAARLHFVEWMRQYYDSSGEEFRPFGLRSQHVEVD